MKRLANLATVVFAALVAVFLLSTLVPVFTADAAPANNPVLPRSSWRGYGVDWCYRSLRVGLAHADSLLEDGWIFCDSIFASYVHFAACSLDWAFIDTLMVGDTMHVTGNARFGDDVVVDSMLTVGDSAYFNASVRVNGRAWFDSIVTIDDSLYVSGRARFASDVWVDDTLNAGTFVVGVITADTVRANDLLESLDSMRVANNALFGGIVTVTDSLHVGALTTDSAATVTLATNLITIGAASVGDHDVVISCYTAGAPLDIMMYDEGDARVEFPTPVLVASMVSTGNVDVNGILNANTNLTVDGTSRLDSVVTMNDSVYMLGPVTIDSLVVIYDSLYVALNARFASNVWVDTNLTVGESLYVGINAFVDGILFADSIDGHSPIYLLDHVVADSTLTVQESLYVAGPTTLDSTVTVGDSLYVELNAFVDGILYADSFAGISLDSVGSFHADTLVVGLGGLWVDDTVYVAGNAYVVGFVRTDSILSDTSLFLGSDTIRIDAAHELELEAVDIIRVLCDTVNVDGSMRVEDIFYADSIVGSTIYLLDDVVADSNLRVKDSLRVGASAHIAVNLAVDSTLSVGDSAYVTRNLYVDGIAYIDSIAGHSPIYLLDQVYATRIDADTIDAGYQLATNYIATDFSNLEGYWEFVAGPDSTGWTYTDSVFYGQCEYYALDALIDPQDTVFVVAPAAGYTAAQYKLWRRDPTLGTWQNLATWGDGGNTSGIAQMCFGGADTIHVVFPQGSYNLLCYSYWDGSAMSPVDTIDASIAGNKAGYISGIGHESGGTLHVASAVNANVLSHWSGSYGSWSGRDTVSTAAYTLAQRHSNVLIDTSDGVHVIYDASAGGPADAIYEAYDPAGGWDYAAISPVSSSYRDCDAMMRPGTDHMYCAFYVNGGSYPAKVYYDAGVGWGQLGGDILDGGNRAEVPSIFVDSNGYVYVAAARTTGDQPILYAYWGGASWSEDDPITPQRQGDYPTMLAEADGDPIIVFGNPDDDVSLLIQAADPGDNTGYSTWAARISTDVDAGNYWVFGLDPGGLDSDSTEGTLAIGTPFGFNNGKYDTLRVYGVSELPFLTVDSTLTARYGSFASGIEVTDTLLLDGSAYIMGFLRTDSVLYDTTLYILADTIRIDATSVLELEATSLVNVLCDTTYFSGAARVNGILYADSIEGSMTCFLDSVHFSGGDVNFSTASMRWRNHYDVHEIDAYMTRPQTGGNAPAEFLVSSNFFVYSFDPDTDEEVFADLCIPAGYDTSKAALVFFHWCPSSTETDSTVTWGIEYLITNPENNESLEGATTTRIVVDQTQGTRNEHLLADTISIPGSEFATAPCCLHLRLFRDADASEIGASDTYTGDARFIKALFKLPILEVDPW